jgi:hypothetical protein
MDKLKNDTTILNKSEQTMLQQFLINQEKTKLSTDEIVALMVDFVLAGITTVKFSFSFHIHLISLKLNKISRLQLPCTI